MTEDVTMTAVWEKLPESSFPVAAVAAGMVRLIVGIGGTYFFMRKRRLAGPDFRFQRRFK